MAQFLGDIDRLKKTIVSITVKVQRTLYSPYQSSITATGFIADTQKGWIVTNKHIANQSQIHAIVLQLWDGQKVKCSLLHNDPEHDFSILTVFPHAWLINYPSIHWASMPVKTGDSVFFLHSISNGSHTLASGTVLDPYLSKGHFSTQVILTDLNATHGDSGSPIWNQEGDVVGVQFAIDNEHRALAILAPYIADAVNALMLANLPRRFGLSVVLDYCISEQLEKYAFFPQEYRMYPKVICVKTILDTPHKTPLQVLDILWKIDNRQIGMDLFSLQRYINLAESDFQIEIIRDGVKEDIMLSAYNLYSHQISHALYLNDATLYDADELSHLQTGVPVGKLFIPDVPPNTLLYSLAFSGIEKISRWHLTTLQDLLMLLPKLMQKENFVVHGREYKAHLSFNEIVSTNHLLTPHYLQLSNKSSYAALLHFDSSTHAWKSLNLVDHLVCLRTKDSSFNSSNFSSALLQEEIWEWDDLVNGIIEGC